jgi:hypothetical protein
MLSTRVFRPTMMAGIVYAREVGSVQPLQPIGGVEEFTISIDEAKVTQANTSSSGGGNRAVVYRINEMTMSAKLQDLNPVNLARSLRSAHQEVLASTVVDEQAGFARAGGLTRLAHLRPTAVVVRTAGTAITIAAAGNYEVRPEGLFWFDTSPAVEAARVAHVAATPLVPFPGLAVEVDYAHSGYDVIQALTASAPILEMSFSGVNEALEDAPSVVDFFRVQLSATQGLNLISAGAFATLDIEGEVIRDSTKTGAGVSKYFKKSMLTPA